MKKLLIIIFVLIGLLLVINIIKEGGQPIPASIPKGISINEIPDNMDLIFDSVRHALSDPACLDSKNRVKKNYINQPDCNKAIYDSGRLAPLKQLFAMDIESGEVIQITNLDCFFVTGQAVDSTTLMANAICSDTDNNGKINDQDKPELYLIDLPTEKMDCLTCGLGLDSINNPDYSRVNKKILFSARLGPDLRYPHHVFTIDAEKNLVELTKGTSLYDFDPAWSEDGKKIVFSRIPSPMFTQPSQVWLMDSNGANLKKITDGGPNPNNEENQGPYPIGIDADPDLSPDNKKIVISRLKTGKQNSPFGVYELIVVDVDTRAVEILDSKYANMIPEWKSGGILFTRQIADDQEKTHPMDIKQSLYIYENEKFRELEKYPYNVFPVGAYGVHWIDI